MLKRLPIFLLACLIATCTAVPAHSAAGPQNGGSDLVFYLAFVARPAETVCRFGVTALPKNSTYNADLKQLRIGAFIDWSGNPSRSLTNDVTYLRVIGLRDPQLRMCTIQPRLLPAPLPTPLRVRLLLAGGQRA